MGKLLKDCSKRELESVEESRDGGGRDDGDNLDEGDEEEEEEEEDEGKMEVLYNGRSSEIGK